MDVKAMARSKRSHTKQHQPRKPHRPTTQRTPPSSSSSSSVSNDPKVLKGEGEEKRSNLSGSLPSNWDQYADSDEDEGLFGSDSASAATADVVKPKSKGADFGFLISQAKSQSPANFSDSFDSVLPDFSQGLGSMLSVRGESILSWTGGDDFLMEDESTTNQEVPFLSLNLQTLGEELVRIDLAQRLFIEEDILPPELRVPQKIERDSKLPVSASVEQCSEVDDLTFQNSSMVDRRIVSKEGRSLRQDRVDTTGRAPLSFRQERHSDDIAAAHKTDTSWVLDPIEPFKATQEAELDNKMPRFGARAAEAELDMLLDSFDETKFYGSSNTESNVPSAFSKQRTSASLFPSGESLVHRASSNDSAPLDLSTSSFPASNMDNDIDDLLQDTSNIAETAIEVNVDTADQKLSSSAHPGSKSKVMEDFDSWLDTI